ncbi:MAG TPA: hypothetical protein VIY54_09665, partial [Steroidobacteraceae bacterium]
MALRSPHLLWHLVDRVRKIRGRFARALERSMQVQWLRSGMRFSAVVAAFVVAALLCTLIAARASTAQGQPLPGNP